MPIMFMCTLGMQSLWSCKVVGTNLIHLTFIQTNDKRQSIRTIHDLTFTWPRMPSGMGDAFRIQIQTSQILFSPCDSGKNISTANTPWGLRKLSWLMIQLLFYIHYYCGGDWGDSGQLKMTREFDRGRALGSPSRW